ncbi:hypothetical protein BD769DRAFT_1667388 [Suillus cothurnatus]|nr:hypothetical protein BD769DRAFT_1667388 [Suillus cothurnatus]
MSKPALRSEEGKDGVVVDPGICRSRPCRVLALLTLPLPDCILLLLSSPRPRLTVPTTSSNKPTPDKAALECQYAQMMAEMAEVQANIELAEAEERCQAEEERKHLAEEEKEKQRELLQIQQEKAEKTWKAKEAKALKAAMKLQHDYDKWACWNCVSKGWVCSWEDVEHKSSIKACDVCRVTKESCAGHPLSLTENLQHHSKASGKKRSHPDGTPSPKGKGKAIIGVDLVDVEYDDQAWVAAANSIVAELAWTNGLLERSIQVAKGSRAAADQMSNSMLGFLNQQRELHNSLLEAIRGGSGVMHKLG